MKKPLNDLAILYRTDKKLPDGKPAQNGLNGHGYTPYYAVFLKTYKIRSMLEIGISFGGSLRMWRDYFEAGTSIYGMDICEKRFNRAELEALGIHVLMADQADGRSIYEALYPHVTTAKTPFSFDFIVDDGGHRMRQQQVSLAMLFPFLTPGGLYAIEDLHTSRYPEFYDSPADKEVTTWQLLKALEEKKNIASPYITEADFLYLKNNIDSIYYCAYEKLCFITKKK